MTKLAGPSLFLVFLAGLASLASAEADGTKNGSPSTVSCPVPGISHAFFSPHVSGSTFTRGTVISISCFVGYQMTGPSKVQCQANGKATQSGECLAVCTLFTQNKLVLSRMPIKGAFLVGMALNASCERGFDLVGPSVVNCGSNGITSKFPTCIASTSSTAAPTAGLSRTTIIVVAASSASGMLVLAIIVVCTARIIRHRKATRAGPIIGGKTWTAVQHYRQSSRPSLDSMGFDTFGDLLGDSRSRTGRMNSMSAVSRTTSASALVSEASSSAAGPSQSRPPPVSARNPSLKNGGGGGEQPFSVFNESGSEDEEATYNNYEEGESRHQAVAASRNASGPGGALAAKPANPAACSSARTPAATPVGTPSPRPVNAVDMPASTFHHESHNWRVPNGGSDGNNRLGGNLVPPVQVRSSSLRILNKDLLGGNDKIPINLGGSVGNLVASRSDSKTDPIYATPRALNVARYKATSTKDLPSSFMPAAPSAAGKGSGADRAVPAHAIAAAVTAARPVAASTGIRVKAAVKAPQIRLLPASQASKERSYTAFTVPNNNDRPTPGERRPVTRCQSTDVGGTARSLGGGFFGNSRASRLASFSKSLNRPKKENELVVGSPRVPPPLPPSTPFVADPSRIESIYMSPIN